jgi:hypothetical protein
MSARDFMRFHKRLQGPGVNCVIKDAIDRNVANHDGLGSTAVRKINTSETTGADRTQKTMIRIYHCRNGMRSGIRSLS